MGKMKKEKETAYLYLGENIFWGQDCMGYGSGPEKFNGTLYLFRKRARRLSAYRAAGTFFHPRKKG